MENKVIIIAEAGVNHNGDLDMAKQLIDAAAAAGADYVKFQTFNADALVSKSAEKADYQKENTGNNDSQYEMLKKLELSHADHHILQDYCLEKRIKFFSTAFDHASIDFLKTLNLGLWKVPSGEITNLPYLEHIGNFNEEVILSTGMSTVEEVADAMQILVASGTAKEKITVLHCTSNYPTPMYDVHLRSLLYMRDKLDVRVGYSDHTLGIEVAIAAVAMGACVIEKHFTLDRNLPGPDHKASLEPGELQHMVKSIRNIELSLGEYSKKATQSEEATKNIARKSIHLSNDLNINHVLTYEDLNFMRPGDGISPMLYKKVIGKALIQNFTRGHKLEWNNIK